MWDDPKALNTLTVALLACALAALVAAGLLWVSRQPAFAIRHVVVQGELKEVNPAHLQAVTREALRGNFFTLNLDAARVAYARVPWVRAVSVRRLWPDRLEVTVSEHQPLARWSAWSGESGLVNTAGELFQADYAGELPGFAGPAGAAGEVSARYSEFKATLARIGRMPVSMRLSARHAWELTLDNQLALALGRDDASERLARFVALYPTTVARATSPVDYVDLRYRSGFAARVASLNEKSARKTARHRT